MLNQSFEGELFHATGGRPYVNLPPLTIGQNIEIGNKINQFFEFYENTRFVPVHCDGKLIKIPAITYLKSVMDGAINPVNLPKIAYDTANHFLMLSRELFFESVRREINDQLPSRQKCMWTTGSVASAIYWAQRCGANSIARLNARGVVFTADASFLMSDSEPISQTLDRARKYWIGEYSETPEIEILFSGTATVLEILPLTAP